MNLLDLLDMGWMENVDHGFTHNEAPRLKLERSENVWCLLVDGGATAQYTVMTMGELNSVAAMYFRPAARKKPPGVVTEAGPLAMIAFARIIEPIREAAKALGYAVAVHGSLIRDIDLVAIPWVEPCADPCAVANAVQNVVKEHFLIAYMGGRPDKPPEWSQAGSPGLKPHGRLCWTFNFGGSWVDLSVMPPSER